MAKRFHDTGIWGEDWFIALPKDYRMLWFFIKDNCDHAGIWRPNFATFNKLFDAETDIETALKLLNSDKERIVVLKNGRWLLAQFIPFQYGNTLNLNSKTHFSIYQLLNSNEVLFTSLRPQVEVIQRVKDKDKDKDININKEEKDLRENRKVFLLPDFIKPETWADFEDMRKKIKKPMTDKARELVIARILKLVAKGHKAEDLLLESIERSWQTVYEPKDNNTTATDATSVFERVVKCLQRQGYKPGSLDKLPDDIRERAKKTMSLMGGIEAFGRMDEKDCKFSFFRAWKDAR